MVLSNIEGLTTLSKAEGESRKFRQQIDWMPAFAGMTY
jgi:hypothetical protein